MSTAGSLRRLRNGSTAVLHRSLARAVHVRQSYVERARHTRSRRRERHWLEFVEEHTTPEGAAARAPGHVGMAMGCPPTVCLLR